jgi:hypothetical protein
MKLINFAGLMLLSSGPLIFITLFVTFIRSSPFNEAILLSVFISIVPFFISGFLIEIYYGMGGLYRDIIDDAQIYFPRFKHEFKVVKEIQKILKEKREELGSLNNVHFKSYIVDIMRKDLKGEIKYLKRQLTKLRNE